MHLREVIRLNELLGRETVVDGVCYCLWDERIYAFTQEGFTRDGVVLLSGMEVIGAYAFSHCSSLTSIEIPQF